MVSANAPPSAAFCYRSPVLTSMPADRRKTGAAFRDMIGASNLVYCRRPRCAMQARRPRMTAIATTLDDITLPQATVKRLGLAAYEPTWRAMQEFTARRARTRPMSCGCCSTPPVYTLGIAGKAEHLPRHRDRHSSRQNRPRRADHLPRPRAGRDLICCSTCGAGGSRCGRWLGAWNRP